MARRTYVLISYQRRRSATVLVIVTVIAAVVIYWVRRLQSRRVLEHIAERYRSRQALLRYVQLHYQCSEEAAYQRLAAFVKRYIPLDDQPSIDYMVAHHRQGLLELAQSILVHNSDEIDEI
jgi:hypothetical protein